MHQSKDLKTKWNLDLHMYPSVHIKEKNKKTYAHETNAVKKPGGNWCRSILNFHGSTVQLRQLTTAAFHQTLWIVTETDKTNNGMVFWDEDGLKLMWLWAGGHWNAVLFTLLHFVRIVTQSYHATCHATVVLRQTGEMCGRWCRPKTTQLFAVNQLQA